ncbi:MAG: CDP-alcohol phosphatidyltransferase family protein [Clostridia bacterium]|nr:CDP-alcohol phosphatidyltransferase family protein [Clostridia bacterium]
MANVITGVRIVCALSLIFCPTFSSWFYGLYILGGISDILDGMAARHSGTETKFGAQLDTVADILFSAVVILKVVRAVFVPTWLILWIVCIAVIKCCNIICGFVLYKRFVSEHTVMNKTCGVLLFAIPFCIGLLPRQLTVIPVILTCAAAAFAAIQEGHYIRTGKEVH